MQAIIETQQEYEESLARVYELMNTPEFNAAQHDELEQLVLVN